MKHHHIALASQQNGVMYAIPNIFISLFENNLVR